MQSLPSLEAQHKTVHRVSAVCHCRCSRSRRQHIPFNQHASGGTDRFRHGSCCWFPREKVAVSFERRERTSQASYVFVLAPVVWFILPLLFYCLVCAKGHTLQKKREKAFAVPAWSRKWINWKRKMRRVVFRNGRNKNKTQTSQGNYQTGPEKMEREITKQNIKRN